MSDQEWALIQWSIFCFAKLLSGLDHWVRMNPDLMYNLKSLDEET